METFRQDLRLGLRFLRGCGGFAIVVLLSVASGIGATSAAHMISNSHIIPFLAPRALERPLEPKDSKKGRPEGGPLAAALDYGDM
jgi:hypothetical protein